MLLCGRDRDRRLIRYWAWAIFTLVPRHLLEESLGTRPRAVFQHVQISLSTCSPQIRSLQSECEDYKTEIDLLKRRIEQLRKRRDYATDS